MVMYSNAGAYPVAALPFRVRRINGLTFTAEAVAQNLGDETNPWFEVSDPPAYDAETHTLNWNGADWVVAEIVQPEPEPEPEPQTAAEQVTGTSTFDFIFAQSGPDEIAGTTTGDVVLAGNEPPDGV